MARKVLPFTDWKRLVGDAISAGAEPRGNGTLYWNCAAGCEKPHTVQLRCYDHSHTQHRYLDIDTRCRKCPPCLKARAFLWRIRMASEIRAAHRTWLVSLTCSPEQHSWLAMAAEHHARKRGWHYAEMSDNDTFRYRVTAASPELTKWAKRIREGSGLLRYCLVAERHKSGLPHWHALVHEADPIGTRHRKLTESWRWGFSHAKLVAADHSEKTAAYVAKYLTKSALSRVRASRGYGQATLGPPHAEGLAAIAEDERGVVDKPDEQRRSSASVSQRP